MCTGKGRSALGEKEESGRMCAGINNNMSHHGLQGYERRILASSDKGGSI